MAKKATGKGAKKKSKKRGASKDQDVDANRATGAFDADAELAALGVSDDAIAAAAERARARIAAGDLGTLSGLAAPSVEASAQEVAAPVAEGFFPEVDPAVEEENADPTMIVSSDFISDAVEDIENELLADDSETIDGSSPTSGAFEVEFDDTQWRQRVRKPQSSGR